MNPGYQYPGQQNPNTPYPVYPPSNPQMAQYPNQPGFNTGFPSQPGYPSSGYPPTQPVSGYPPAVPGSGYPSTQPGYPSAQPGYPSTQPSSGYPSHSTPGYPPAQPSAYPPSTYPSIPAAQPAPQSGFPYPGSTPSYPPSQPSYPNSQQTSAYPTQSYTQQAPITATHMNVNYQSAPKYGNTGSNVQFDRPNPTVVPASAFNARADAEALRKAMKGFGTDEKTIISVLTKRSNSQRQEIYNQFKALYGKDLLSDLKSELSGKFEDLVIALMTPLPEFLAKEIQHAMEGVGTNEETLVEILCTATNAQIFAIRDAYGRLFSRSLENDLRNDTSGHFKRLLVSIVQGRRSETMMVDESAVAKDARDLMGAGVLMVGTDESTFNAILCTRSYPHLRRVLTEYQRVSGHTLEKAIRGEFSGDIKDGLLAIVHCVEDRPGFFAERLRDSIACVGTKDRQLIRIVVSRSEMDMQDIKRAYQLRYQKSLEQAISEDTSGDYKKALLALISGY